MEDHWLCFVLSLELGPLSFLTKGLPLRPKFVLFSSVFVPEGQAEVGLGADSDSWTLGLGKQNTIRI